MRPHRKFSTKLVLALSLSTFGLSACTGAGHSSTIAQASRNELPGTFTYVHLCASPDGATHFKDESVSLAATPFAPPAQPIATGGAKAASRVLFLGFQPRWGESDLASKTPHSTPIRQFITVLQGELTIYASDGAVRRFRRGDIFLVDDANTKGHITVVGDEPTVLQASQVPVTLGP